MESPLRQTFSQTPPAAKLGRSRRTLVVASQGTLSGTSGVSLIDATLPDGFRCGVQIERLRSLNKERRDRGVYIHVYIHDPLCRGAKLTSLPRRTTATKVQINETSSTWSPHNKRELSASTAYKFSTPRWQATKAEMSALYPGHQTLNAL